MTETAATVEMKRGATWARRTPPARSRQSQGGGAVYGLGMIGALAYFVGTSQGGRDYALAVGKAFVWPALLVYRAFRYLDQ
jgi:hypothetical protein